MHDINFRGRIPVLHKDGLKKGLGRLRGMRRALTDEEQNRVVGEIDAQLWYGWKIEQVHRPVGPNRTRRSERRSTR